MKKTESINIGGRAFVIDDDAFIKLENYIKSLEYHFGGHEGCEEIMEDIEIRIAELFSQELKYRNVITTKDLNQVISIMGTASDFDLEERGDMMYDNRKSSGNAGKDFIIEKPKRRLFRDEERKVLGGVAAGLAAYFGIENPRWVRAFVILSAFFGMPLLVYIVMWIVVPAARTASDKLQMRGEAINIDNIVKSVENELVDIKDKLEDFGKDLTNKKKTNGFAS